MNINFYEKEQLFCINTEDSSYVISVTDDEKFLGHVYYGKKIDYCDLRYLQRLDDYPTVPSVLNRERSGFMDNFRTEYPGHGLGDFRDGCITVKNSTGNTAVGLNFTGYKIYNGKPGIPGQPATFGNEQDSETLEIYLEDRALKLSVTLRYSVFAGLDAIARSAVITNCGDETLYLTKALSAALDFEGMDYDTITLHGAWAREKRPQRKPLGFGKLLIDSNRGISSAQSAPFMAVVGRDTNEDCGDAYGINLVYSGNFMLQAEVPANMFTRVTVGINAEDFCWKLVPGDTFDTPEAVFVYSSEGTGKMSRTFHDLYRNHIIRSPYKDKKRPILINNWEATYFNFNEEKIYAIAEQASKLGIEMLVMDDGWFGKRDDDNSGLGDWFVNEKKLKGGLKPLVDRINALGMKFGIWFEPEMVCPDSDLYRAHPDYAIQIKGRQPVLGRNQLVLDITRKEVRDCVYKMVSDILHSANIEYVKWDMNRPLTDIGSFDLPADQMGEFFHRYMLAVYELQERLITEFPNLLLENCSSGGGRFDAGTLFYSPQVWGSDDTDAIERLRIQRGTSYFLPLSAIGAHVSDCPNHTVGRTTPFETRGHVALAGTFGYELDVTRIPEADRNMIPAQTAMYHKYNDLVRMGDYFRIANFDENGDFDAYMVVAKDKSEALVTAVNVLSRASTPARSIKLKGLDPKAVYREEETGAIFTGSALMYAGFVLKGMNSDFKSRLIHFIKE